MSAKHTPGPWEAREVRTQVGRAFRIGAGEMLEAGKGCCIIYDDYPGSPDNERAANARLIAAAPLLLERCRAAALALRSYQYGNASPELAEEIASACEAAVAAAEGR
jgi:hypothetical protein